jgi:hypothetical protein
MAVWFSVPLLLAFSGLVRRTSVAFEIDGIDEHNKSGWSVLVPGFAEAMAHNCLLASAWETGPVPWAERETCSSKSNRARSAAAPSGHAPGVESL